jgi:hypothetical protein
MLLATLSHPQSSTSAGLDSGVEGRFSGTIPFGWCGRLISPSTKTKFASCHWFSKARERRKSELWLNPEREDRKSLPCALS